MNKLVMSLMLLAVSSLTIADDYSAAVRVQTCETQQQCDMQKVDDIADIMMQRIQRNWSVEQSLRNLRAKIHLNLNHDGQIVLLEIDQSSDDEVFDESLLVAIKASFPIEQIKLLSVELFEAQLKENRILFKGEKQGR